MYAQLVEMKKESKNLRIQLHGELKDRWDALLESKNISQQNAIAEMVRFVLDQKDDVIQSMIFGQVEPRADLIEFALKRKTPERTAYEEDAVKRKIRQQGGRGSVQAMPQKQHGQ